MAPSAEAHAEDIDAAVRELNRWVGEELFTLRAVSSGERRDGQIVVRGTDYSGQPRVGHTSRTRDGVVVTLGNHTNVRVVAHELCHAAGLAHSDDPNNLMYKKDRAGAWSLTDEQIEQLIQGSP